MEITNKNLVQLMHDIFSLHRAHFADLPVNPLQFLAEFLSTGFPLNPEPPVPALGTVVCKSEKGERLLSTM